MFVRQAAHVLDLLEFFATTRKPATLSEVSEHMGWPRSSTFNILYTLAEKGFLYEPKARAGYYPSPRWLALSQLIVDSQPLPADVYTLVAELTAETGETALVGASAGTSAIFLHVVESPAAIKYVARVGHRVPITATATGRAIMSQYSSRELSQLLRRVKFEKLTDTTLVSVEEVEAELKRAAERGYHKNPAGNVPDLFGISIPLPVESRRLAVTVAGPSFRTEERTDEIAAIMHAAIKRHGFGTAKS